MPYGLGGNVAFFFTYLFRLEGGGDRDGKRLVTLEIINAHTYIHVCMHACIRCPCVSLTPATD